jgi:F0F1-type ATP synthase delta subunit
MAYGYIKGTERASLSYFEALLSQTVDLNERKKLEPLVQELREAVNNLEQASEAQVTEALKSHPDSLNLAPR